MNLNRIIFATFGLGFCLASCSDTDLQPSVPDNGLTTATTFRVSIESEAESRAGTDLTDPTPTRAFMYVSDNTGGNIIETAMEGTVNGNSFEFTLSLSRSHSYTIAFWADAGGYAIDSSDGLAKISYETASDSKQSIAYSYCNTSFTPAETTAQITLQHAVAKLVLRETGSLNIGDKVDVSFTRNNYVYSAVSQSYSTDATAATTPVALSLDVTSDTQSGDIIETYMLAPNDTQKAGSDPSMLVSDFKITYTPSGETQSHSQTITNVPFKSNSRTIIKGSIMGLSILEQTFAVSINSSWSDITVDNDSSSSNTDDTTTPGNGDDNNDNGGNSEISEITLTVAGTLTEAMLTEKIGSGNSLKISGPMGDKDFTTLKTYLAQSGTGASLNLSLDLSGASFTSMPDCTFLDGTLDIRGNDNSNPITGLKSISLPEGLTEIPEGAFADCTNLTTVTIPSTVTTISDMAFYRSGITELYAPSVTVVGGNVCESCSSLTTVTLGNLTNIGNYAFRGCTSLTTFDITRCTSKPTSGMAIFGTSTYGVIENLTIYVCSDEMKTALSSESKWNDGQNPKFVVGSPE